MNGLPANRSCRTLFQTRNLTLMPRGAPVLVGHDSEREVGVVDELVEWPDTDGLWLFARCTINAPPTWLRRGTKASFECLPLQEQRMGDWNRIMRGLVREVSILQPGLQPAEPRAGVWLLQRAAETTSTTQRRSMPTTPPLRGAHPAKCSTRRPMPPSAAPSARCSPSDDDRLGRGLTVQPANSSPHTRDPRRSRRKAARAVVADRTNTSSHVPVPPPCDPMVCANQVDSKAAG